MVLDVVGKPLSKENWKVAYISGEELKLEDDRGEHHLIEMAILSGILHRVVMCPNLRIYWSIIYVIRFTTVAYDVHPVVVISKARLKNIGFNEIKPNLLYSTA